MGVETPPGEIFFFVEYDLGPSSELDTASDVDPADMQGLHRMTSRCQCKSHRPRCWPVIPGDVATLRDLLVTVEVKEVDGSLELWRIQVGVCTY
jgi:hypothetical protein